MKHKQLQVMAWSFLILPVVLGGGEVAFDAFIAPLGTEINLLFLVVVLLNFLQATALFLWADVLESRSDRRGTNGTGQGSERKGVSQ
jgi:hypothetical protein